MLPKSNKGIHQQTMDGKAMKYFIILTLILTSSALSQEKAQRFLIQVIPKLQHFSQEQDSLIRYLKEPIFIYKDALAAGTDKDVLLLDTQTGKTWVLINYESEREYQKSKLIFLYGYAWMPVPFTGLPMDFQDEDFLPPRK